MASIGWYDAAAGRRIDALLANAGHGLGHAFLDQDFTEVRHVIDTNITGTVYLIQKVGRDMRAAGRAAFSLPGELPGSCRAPFMPSTRTKAFIDSFSFALRNELKDSGVTVTCLMPGATDTEFFERADLMDTKVVARPRTIPRWWRRTASRRCRRKADVVSGWKNKLQNDGRQYHPE